MLFVEHAGIGAHPCTARQTTHRHGGIDRRTAGGEDLATDA